MEIYQKPKNAEDLFFHIQHKDYPVRHTHDGYWEFMLLTSGTLVHKINGQKQTISKNTLCIIRPEDVHSLHNPKGSSSSHINLGVTCEYLKQYVSLLSPISYKTLHGAPPIRVALSTATTDSIVNQAYKILSSDKKEYQIRLKLLFLDVMREIYSHLIKEISVSADKYSQPVRELLEMMLDPKYMTKPLDELIRKTHYSSAHINRLFNKELGTTPGQYFKEKKFDYAKKLLTETDLTSTEIAFRIGYESYPHFSVAFKKATGSSPTAYAKNEENHFLSVEETSSSLHSKNR